MSENFYENPKNWDNIDNALKLQELVKERIRYYELNLMFDSKKTLQSLVEESEK